MSSIETYLNYILNKIFARDVRTAIVNAIRQCYDDVHNPTLNTEALQAAIQAKIDAGQMAALTIGDRTITAAKLALGVIPTPDTTLSQSGVPADAKTTGDEISAINESLDDVKADLDALETIVGENTSEPDTYDLTSSDMTRKLGLNRGTNVAYPYTYTRNDVIGYQGYEILLKPDTEYIVTATVTSAYASSAEMLVDMYDQSMLNAYNSRANIDMAAHHVGNGWGALTQQISSHRQNAAGEAGAGLKFMIRQNSSGSAIADDFAVTSIHIEEVVPESGTVVRFDVSQDKTPAEKKQARENIDAAENIYVTPQMFGAKGDGVTDDTTAFQSAINTQCNVFVPMRDGQKYVITNTLVFSKNRQVIYGDIENSDWGFGGCILFDASNSILFDFKASMEGCANLSVHTEGSDNIAARFKKDSDITNIDGSVINCGFRRFDVAIDHYGRGLNVKRNVFFECSTCVKTTIRNDPQWDHSDPTLTELVQTYPEYNGRSLYIVDNRFHVIYDKYLIVESEDYISGGTTLKQTLNGAIITGNMSDLGRGSFEFKAPIKGCIFSNNEFLMISPDVFFDCQEGASDCSIANNTIRGLVDANYPRLSMTGKDCFAFNGLNYSSISGNVIENFKQRCVYCYGTGMNNSAAIGNVFKNFGIDTTVNQYERAGFDVPNCENSIISNNTFMTVSDFNGYLIRARDVSSNVWKRNVFNDNACAKRSSAEVLVPTTAGTEDNIVQGVS